LTPEPEDKASRFTEIAVAWEKQLGSVDQAIAAYREVLKVDDVNLNGLRQLERIFQALSRWEELVEVLESQCRALFEPEEVIGIRMRIGQIWETRLENDKNAVVAYKEILKLDEQHRDALEALERLYQKLGQWNDLLKVYEMQLAAAMTGEEQIVLYSKMATVYEEEFSDAENAINCMRQITMVDPSNLMAIQNLERLYRKHEQWLDLIDALNTHIGAVARDSDRIEIYRQLGEVFRDQLEDTYRAIDSFQNLLAISPSDHDGLVALGGLFEQSADWISAIEIYNRLIPVATSTEEGVATHYRVGRIYDEHLADSAQAEERFQTALDIEPSYMPAIDALYTLYERREDYNAMVRILKQKVEYTRELEDRAGLLCGIGQIYDLRLDDQINAVDYYEQTLQLSPTNVNAGRPLAEKFIRERAWARALVLLEMIIQKLSFARDASDLYLLNYKAGLCCQELGQDEKALHFFRASYELNQTHLPTLLGMGRELYHAKDFERAYKMFQTILVQYAHELTGEQLVEIYSDSAKIKRATNELSAARGLLQKVFELDPNHRASLSMMIELSEEQEDWQAVAAYKQMRLQTMSDPNEVFAEWTELAELLRSQLGDTEQALECYKQALFVDPESKFVLIKLLEIYTVSKRWMEALETLKRLCDIESNKDRLAKYHYTMAVICRDELGDEQTSIDFFNLCLDDNVNELRAFEAIDRIITANKDWKALERNYRKMIKRVMDNDEGQFEDTKYLLWYGLAEIYRTRLNEWDSAISAFQQASVLKPHDANMHKILADLYVRREHDDEAIEEFRTLIKMPGEGSFVDRNANHFHSLFKLFLKTKRYDQAWCVCNVMVYLNIATEDERQFNERYVGPALVQASGRIDPDTWKLIYHPENNLRIGSILQVMATHCRELFVYDLRKTWGLRKKDELDQNADLLFCKIYRYMAQVIGVIPTPKLYFNREQPLGMLNGNVDPPGFIVGADMQGRNQRELAFIIARQLSMAVPLHYMAGLRLPSETLRFLVLGAMHASTQPASAPMEPNLEAVVKTIVRMPPPIAVELHKLVKAVIEGRVEVNTSKWLKGVDYTTNRVGLLLCGDLSTAMTAIRNDATPVSKLSTSEKEIDLVQFAISDRFFELRSRLKLSIS
ncbi:MAG: hypothetical protein RBU37_01565, partial [Myxococcota bacterium]|nr:hypothetical protein [Myxococcota bacterium]